MKKIINTINAPTPIGPYNQAMLAGNFLFLSGQIALDSLTGELVTTDIESETKKVMQNIEAILHEAGLEFKHIVKSSIFLTNMEDFALVNEVYGSYFTDNYPARETVQVAALPKGVHVEISVIATNS
ncbi:MAG: RidA family protein [Sphingobacteriaceae bacterium]